jgi:acetolactate synthase-1/2/3 large subunit
MTEYTGAQILMKCLKAEGVDVIFGYPGGAVIDVYHELDQTDIRHILVRHEQAAVHAADGYARVSGKTGVVLVTSGPGATNTVTGIASAYMDSIPLVVFTGQAPLPLLGADAFQEVDIIGITRPCTKHSFLVRDVRDLVKCVSQAFYLARSGRPGPVLVDLPKDVLQAKAPFAYPEEVRMEGYQPNYQPHTGQLRKAFDAVLEAERPLIYGGGGIIAARASEELTAFARKLRIPVTMTLMGLGGFPGDDPLWLGMLGMHGTYAANMAVDGCDLLLAVGARFDDRVTGKIEKFAPNARIAQIDIDPTSIGKNVRVDIPITADCKAALTKFNCFLSELNGHDWAKDREGWLSMIDNWKTSRPLAYRQDPDGPIKPQFVVETIHRLTGGQAVIATEVGQNQMWTAQHYRFNRPNAFVSSGGLGCMGFGLPASIGAQLAAPDKTVFNIAGDGSIQMNIQELATATQYNLPVKIAILNNGFLGMVRQWQELFKDGRYAFTQITAPDFVALAHAYGAVGIRAEHPEEVEPAIRRAIECDGPVVIDFRVEREENVSPMVPAGEAITNMMWV